MQSNRSKRNRASWGVFAVLWAVLAAAAGGGASAAPVETVLHSFAGGSLDGAGAAFAGLIADSSGNLYGTDEYCGGASGSGCGGSGCGVVFKLLVGRDRDGAALVYGGAATGVSPVAGLIADSSGNLYGTTETGGVRFYDSAWCSSSGRTGQRDGALLLYGNGGDKTSIAASQFDCRQRRGDLYTRQNLAAPSDQGNGVVFKRSPGRAKTVLYSLYCRLINCNDGFSPITRLITDSSGNLYGMTDGGRRDGDVTGVVFKLSQGGTETVLFPLQFA